MREQHGTRRNGTEGEGRMRKKMEEQTGNRNRKRKRKDDEGMQHKGRMVQGRGG